MMDSFVELADEKLLSGLFYKGTASVDGQHRELGSRYQDLIITHNLIDCSPPAFLYCVLTRRTTAIYSSYW
jgi:hypothetical protein